jgi:hypothetical protein
MLRRARAAFQRLLPPARPAFTDSAAPGSTWLLSELLVDIDILDGLPDSGPQLIAAGDEPTVRGRFVAEVRRAQELLSSGVVEGLNNQAKVTMRKSYGFRTYHVLELALDHSLGKLPEPESTHDFF